MESILVTGANRGIGLELARQFSSAGWQVLAACRKPDEARQLNELAETSNGGITVHRLEVTSAEDIRELASAVGDRPLDILVNNAGVYGPRNASFGNVHDSDWIETFRINTIAPLRLAEAFAGNVEKSGRKVIATITSKMGSIDDNTSGRHYIYRTSKAAVNMVNRSLSVDLRDRGITCVVLHPGWVRTEMGGSQAPLAVEDSVRGLVKVLTGVTVKDTGSFIAHDGSRIPW